MKTHFNRPQDSLALDIEVRAFWSRAPWKIHVQNCDFVLQSVQTYDMLHIQIDRFDLEGYLCDELHNMRFAKYHGFGPDEPRQAGRLSGQSLSTILIPHCRVDLSDYKDSVDLSEFSVRF